MKKALLVITMVVVALVISQQTADARGCGGWHSGYGGYYGGYSTYYAPRYHVSYGSYYGGHGGFYGGYSSYYSPVYYYGW